MPTYTLNNVNYTYTVGTVAASVGTSASASGSITLLSSFVVDGATYDVTSIGASAFENRTGLTSVVIPDSVTSIGSSAFRNCTLLTSITLSNTLTSIGASAFQTSSITSITFPASLTSIGSSVFSGCSNLVNVVVNSFYIASLFSSALSSFNGNNGLSVTFDYVGTIPASVCRNWYTLVNVTIGPNITSIGATAFQGCTALENVTLPNSLTSIGDSAFYNCNFTSITLPNSLTSIGASAFYNCTKITSITLPNTLTSIAATVFQYCTALANVTMSTSVTSIGTSAFNNCSLLTSITLPDTLTIIGTSAFQQCSSLANVTMSTSVTSIGANAFNGCSSLTSITFPASLTTTGSVGTNAFGDCGKLANVVVNSSVIGSVLATKISAPRGAGLSVTFDYVGTIASNVCFDWITLKNVTIGPNITSIGATAFKACIALTNVTMSNSVTTIGASAFQSCTALTSITLSETLTIIDSSAFQNCTSLANVTMSNSVTSIGIAAFQNCTSLANVTMSNSVTSIGTNAFYDCTALTTITLPDTLTIIGTSAFQNCTKLANVTMSNSATSIGANAFQNCTKLANFTMSNSVTSIGASAFNGCSSLTSITFPASLTTAASVGSYVFDGCSKLVNIVVNSSAICSVLVSKIPRNAGLSVTFDYVGTIPASVCTNWTTLVNITIGPNITSIDTSAFQNCSLLTSITLPNSVTSIGENAFSGCTKILNVTMSNTVTSIGIAAFENCSLLTSITLPNTLTSIGASAFNGCRALTAVTISNSVTSIGAYTFQTCTNLTSITLPETLTTIGISAFNGCTLLSNITLPNTLTSIGASAFNGCSALTTVTMSTSVTSIGANAFNGCSSLTSITFPASLTTTGSVGTNTFAGCTKLVNIVVKSSVIGSVLATKISAPRNAGLSVTFDYVGTIASNVCLDWTTLKNVTIGPNITSIGATAFQGCIALTNVTMSNSVTTIGASAFKSCTALTSITLSDTLTIIDSSVFQNCTSLATVNIPTSVTQINNNAFSDSGITTVNLPSVTYISNAAFQGCSALASVTLPSVITITSYAFQGCIGLTSVILSTATTSLSSQSFLNCPIVTNVVIKSLQGCQILYQLINSDNLSVTFDYTGEIPSDITANIKNLTNIIFGPNITKIGYSAFENCTLLTTVTIPDSVTIIESSAFQNCSSLNTVTINNTSLLTTIDSNAFAGCILLNSINIPFWVTSIADNAFLDTAVIVGLAATITDFSVPAKTFGDASFSLIAPTSNSDGAFTYTSSDTTVATINGSTVTIVGGGTSTIAALQSFTGTYRRGSIAASLVVSKVTTVLTDFSVATKTFGDASFNITAPTTNGNGAFTYTSSDTSVATVTGSVLTIVGAGSSTITAVQASTASSTYETITAALTVNQATPVMTNFVVPAKIIADASFSLIAPTSNSSGAFTYTSSNLSVATIDGDVVTIVGKGTSIITADQASTTNYLSGSFTSMFIVGETPVITDFSVPAKTYGDVSFALDPPTTNSDGIFTYTSSDVTVATVSGDIVTVVKPGTTTITATQSLTINYVPGSITASFVVSQATPEITNFVVPEKRFGDADFTIVPPTTNSTGAFTYTSSDTSVATVSGSTITVVNLGTSTITAVQAATTNYLSETITAPFTVNQAIPIITNFVVPAKVTESVPFTLVNPTSNSSGPFSYTSSDLLVATIDGDVVTIVGKGTTTISADQESTVNYLSGTIDATLIVRLTPVITDFSVPAKTYGDVSFALVPPTTDSDGIFTYTSSDVTVATVSGDIVTVVGGGSATITATQSLTPNYVSGSITASLVVSQATPEITNFSVVSKTFGNAAFTIVPPTTNSTGAFTYTSSDISVATVTGSTITIVGGGSSTITANQASTTNFLSGSIPATFTVNQAAPTMTNFVVPSKVTTSEPFTIVNPTSNSSGLYTYTSSDLSVATIEGNVVTIVGKGTSTITADQESTVNYLSGSITSTLIVRLTPVITDFSVPEKTYGDAAFAIVPPITDSDGVFTYTSSNTAVATIAGSTITIVGGGSATITATQSLTPNYVAEIVTAPLVVNKATTVLSNFDVVSKTFGNAAFTIVPPTTNSTGAFSYTSSDTSVATVAGSRITIVGGGSTTITANQATTTNHLAETIPATFIVNQATPVITNFSIPAKVTVSAPFTIVAPTSNSSGLYTYTSSDLSVATIEGNVVTIVGKGTSTITANQDSTTNYLSGSIAGTLIVRITPTMTNFVVPVKTFGDAAFEIVPPTTDSDGVFTYTSSNAAVATISGSTITIVGGGSATITATQSLTDNYISGTITTPLVVNKATTVLSSFDVPAKTFGNAAFAITPPTTNSNGAFTYTSSNTAVATVAGSTITIVGGGSATITANQATTPNYTSSSITASLTVSQATTVLSNFSVPTKIIGNAAFAITAPTTNGNGAFTYTSSNTAVATIAGSTITIVGVGSATITADQASTTNYLSASTTANFQVNQITTVLSNFSVPAKQFADANFAIVNPTTNSIGAFTYTSSNTAVATIVGNMITIVGVGSATITAAQENTTNYTAASITASLAVSKGTTVLSNFAVATKTFGDAAFAIVPPTTNGDGLITYTSSNAAVATIAGSTITIVGAGTATITANQATTTNYLAATTTASFTVNKATTVLTNFVVPVKVIRNAPFTITPPTTNSIGTFTYTSSDPSIATIAGTTITIVGIGISTITATQATTANFLAGTVTAAFQVNNVTPTLSFSIPTKTIIDAPYTIAPPTSNSTGTFTYTSSNPSVATIVNGVVTIVALGTTTITAVQAETADYISGTISATLQIIKATPALEFTMPVKTIGNPTFLITPSTDSDGLMTYESSNHEVATIVGNRVTLKGVGTSIITVSQEGTANYTSITVTDTLQVNQIITELTNFSLPAKTYGDIPYKIQASSNSSAGITYTSSDSSVATIAGDMVTIIGAGTTTITASQESWYYYSSASISETLQVNQLTTVLSRFNIPVRTVGTAAFALVPPLSNRGGAFTYTSSDTDVATIDGNLVTLVGGGSATITATQSGNDSYTSESITATLTATRAIPVLTGFAIPTKSFGDSAFIITPPSSTSDGEITYTSSNKLVALVDGNIVTIVNAGTCAINVFQAGTTNYVPATINAPFVVSKAVTTMTNFSVATKLVGDAPFTLVPPATNSNGAFTYTSSDTAVATIDKNVVTVVGIGSTTITAVQPITANYISGTISTTFTVTQGIPVLSGFVVPEKIAGDATFTLVPPRSNSNGAFTYTSSDISVATIDGDVVTIVGRGISTITAVQASTPNFASGTINALFTVDRITTSLTNFSVASKLFTDASFTLVPPTSNSDGAFTYTSSDTAVATIVGDVVTIVGGGNATITAEQAITATYKSATISALFQVNQVRTDITNFSVPIKIIGEADFALVPPTTNGDGAFTYTSSDTDVATIEGDIVTIVGLGDTTISVVQESTANYTSDTISTTFQVKRIRTVLSNFTILPKNVGDASFALVPPTTNSDGAFSYSSSNKLVATVDGDVVTIVGTGNVTIIADQQSTVNSTAAQITASLLVNKSENAIDWFSVPEKAFGNAPFTLVPPTTLSNGAFTYTSSDPEVATIVKNVVTIVGVGTSTITAAQAKTVNYAAGTITANLIVGQGTPVLTNFVIPAKTVDIADFTIVPPVSNSDGAFTYTSADTTVATVAGNVVTIVGVGTAIITATQASTTNFVSATIPATLTVNQITTVLTNFVVATKTFGDASFALVPPTSNSDGIFTYTSSNPAVATISNNVVTIIGAGNANITAVQASAPNYKSATITALFQVTPITTVLSNFVVPAKIIGEGEFTLVPPTTVSNNVFTYTSSNEEVATIVDDTVTIVGLGSTTITAVQESTTNYTAAQITALFNVNLIKTVLTDFVVASSIVGDASFALVPPTTNTAGAFTYTSSNLLVATIAEDIVTIVGVGTATITAVQSSTANSTFGTISAQFVVDKRSPTITNFSIPEKSFGNLAFNITRPTTNGVGAFTYTSSDTSVATIAGSRITIIGVGTSTITAVQASTANFASGTITSLFKVNLGTPILTNFVVPAKTFGDADFSVVAPTTNNDTEITYTSSNPAVATMVDDVITIVGAGTSTITANQAVSEKYLASSVSTTLTVNQSTPVLTNFFVPTKLTGTADFAIEPPTSNSNGTFTYTSSNTAVATINGNMVTVVGGGNSTITAVQASTANYKSATVITIFQVSALTTVLSNFSVGTKTVGNVPFALVPPTTNSNAPFTYTSSNTSIATIAGNMMTIVGAGTSTISAIQSSNSSYSTATITAILTVNKGTPVINFIMPIKEIGMPDFAITDPSSNSTGAFTYTSSNIKVATVFKNIVSIKGLGTSTITAVQAMSANYVEGTVTTSFVVNQLSPTVSAFTIPATKTVGDATFKIVAPKSNSISPFVFTSSNIAVAKITKDVVTIVGAGTAIISGTQASTKSYGPKTVTATLNVNAKISVLSNFYIPAKIIGSAAFALVPPTSTGNGAFTYTSSDTNVATIAGNMVTIIGLGSSTITANQASTSNFTAGTISTTFVVSLPKPQVGALQITNKSLDNSSFTIVDPTKPIDNTGTWTYTSSNTACATVSGNAVTLLQPGIVTITASLSGDSTYSPAMLMTQFSISNLNVAPSSFVFVKSSDVAAAIPATVLAVLNVVVPTSVSNPANIAKFNPALGTVAEKQANQQMVVNTLCSMFPQANTISVPTTLVYVPLAFNKTKLKTIKIVRPTGTTDTTPRVINTITTDSAVAFLSSMNEIGNAVQYNGVGSFVGSFIKIVRGIDNRYIVTRSSKGVVTTAAVALGDIISFVGISALVGY